MVFDQALKDSAFQESAEEVVQEVFWHVWRAAERCETRSGSVGEWLAILARSWATDVFRARRGDPAREDDMTEKPILTDNPIETARSAQRALVVRNFLENLSRRWRLAIELSFFPGLPHGEISIYLGEPLVTATTCLRAGRRPLKKAVEAGVGRTRVTHRELEDLLRLSVLGGLKPEPRDIKRRTCEP